MTKSTATYFVLFSDTSANSPAGLRPDAMWTFERDILAAAGRECDRRGIDLRALFGIDLIEDAEGDMVYARELTPAESLEASAEKLGDDGRLYAIYPTTSSGAAEFIADAENYGAEAAARAVVEEFDSALMPAKAEG